MKAELVVRRRIVLRDDAFIDMTIWRVPVPVAGSRHGYKYRLAFVEREICRIRYDNERGKGDHRHLGDVELPYSFSTIEALIADFLKDVEGHRE